VSTYSEMDSSQCSLATGDAQAVACLGAHWSKAVRLLRSLIFDGVLTCGIGARW
jgi:hypothetical protein